MNQDSLQFGGRKMGTFEIVLTPKLCQQSSCPTFDIRERRSSLAAGAISGQLSAVSVFNRISSLTRNRVVGQFEITDLAGRLLEELAGLLE